jgi:hypothetical protein
VPTALTQYWTFRPVCRSLQPYTPSHLSTRGGQTITRETRLLVLPLLSGIVIGGGQEGDGHGSVDEDTSVPNLFPHVGYRFATGGSLDFLLLAKPPNASPAVVTVYSGYGAWQHNEDNRVRLEYFTYGSATPLNAMPRTGKVTCRVPGTGNYAADDALSFAYHDTLVTVDFATGQVTASMTWGGQTTSSMRTAAA